MTTKQLLRITALTCALLLGFTALAQVEFQPCRVHHDCTPTGIQNPEVKTFYYSSYPEFNQAKIREQVRKAAAKAEGQICTITLNLEYDADVLLAPFMAYITDDSNIIGYAMQSGENMLQGQIPSGTCNINVSSTKIN